MVNQGLEVAPKMKKQTLRRQFRSATAKDIRGLFEPFGEVVSCYLSQRAISHRRKNLLFSVRARLVLNYG